MRRLPLAFILLLFLAPAVAIAQPKASTPSNLGLGTFALLHPSFPCDETMNAFRTASHLRFAYLVTTFGDDRRCLERLLNDPRPKTVEIILFNYNCVKWNRCGPYEPLAGETERSLRAKLDRGDAALLALLRKVADDEATKIKPFLRPGTTWLVSPMLEHRLGESNAVAIEISRRSFPWASMVDNPLAPTPPVSNADLVERHGEFPEVTDKTLLNLDGIDAFSIDLPAYIERGKAAPINLLWILEFNGNCRDSSTFIDPRERRCFPNPSDLARLGSYLR